MKITLTLVLAIAFIFNCSAENFPATLLTEDGEIRGQVTDSLTGTPIPSATILLLRDNDVLLNVTADTNGAYVIKPLKPGYYSVKASFVGYASKTITQVLVTANRFTELNFQLSLKSDLPEARVTYTPPMIEKDNVITCKILTPDEIKTTPYTNLRDLASTSAGVVQKEEGGAINIRGARAEATQYYIDGIKIIGGFSLPKNAIAQMQVITGGVPAMYGDATGGIVVITTKSYMSGW